MNPIFSRILKACCIWTAAVLLTACGGATSTVDPFRATRVIAFGDGFNYVDDNGSGVSTVRTSVAPAYVTDDTIAGRIAARYGIVVKQVSVSNPLASTGGFSYASANARVADVDAQITRYLSDTGGSVAKKDLIVIAVGNWDIHDATISGTTTMVPKVTALMAAIQRLTNAGAEHVVVLPPINMSRTPWATTYVAVTSPSPSATRSQIENLSNTATTSFNFALLAQITTTYRQDVKTVLFLDRTGNFNTFAGSVDASGATVANYSGALTLNNLGTAVCVSPSSAAGCALADVAAGTDYSTAVFADDINLTPLINRYFADLMLSQMTVMGWAP